MTQSETSQSQLPVSALLLGSAGLIPFFGLAIWQGRVSDELLADRLILAYVFYAASILSFLGGIGWGLAMSEEDPMQRGLSFSISTVPSLVGWAAAFINVQNLAFSLGILGAAFVLQGFWDFYLVQTERAPRWFAPLRLGLTIAVIASMAILWFTQADFSGLA
jgi:hypothetical protein